MRIGKLVQQLLDIIINQIRNECVTEVEVEVEDQYRKSFHLYC